MYNTHKWGERMIYLDYAATTPLNRDVYEAYIKLLKNYFANADSAYSLGYQVSGLIEKSREHIASMLKIQPQEIIFTSCASEANNMAIKGACFQYSNRGKHIITTKIEHSSVDASFKQMAEVFGFEVDYLDVDNQGMIDLQVLENMIREDTILVSTMYVNNEIGSILPVSLIADIIHRKNPKTRYHVDMVQALGKIPINLKGIDLASFSAHKIYGLKGSGLLYKNHRTLLIPLITAGQQEYGLRGGTSDSAKDIVFAKTLRLALEAQQEHYDYVIELNQYLREELKKREAVFINSPKNASPYLLNFSVPHYKPEVLVHYLETSDIYLSARSACTSKKQDISHTLQATAINEEIGLSALRLSLSHLTQKEELKIFIKALDQALTEVKKQR